MCGFAGFLGYRAASSVESATHSLQKMAACLERRGPDDQGHFFWPQERLGFVHRRLSVIDTTHRGHQPMRSESGRYTIIYNGEWYDFHSYRALFEKEGYAFLSDSDTEVVLASCEIRGVEWTLQHINGMFALALWDNQEKILYLARDSNGKKPLYYGYYQNQFFFASDIAAILSVIPETLSLSPEALSLYFATMTIPAPHTIYTNFFQLEAGNYIALKAADQVLVKQAFTKANDGCPVLEKSCMPAQWIESLEEELTAAIRRRLVADVPVGVFLSSGVDSNLIAAIAASLHPGIHSYSVGFETAAFDESKQAAHNAKVLGTQHTSFTMTDADILAVMEQWPIIHSQPYADSSLIPFTFLCQQTQGITVSLTGDGADEYFWGYERYLKGLQWLFRVQKLPHSLRTLLYKANFPRFFLSYSPLALQCEKGQQLLSVNTLLDYYLMCLSPWHQQLPVAQNGTAALSKLFPTKEAAQSSVEQLAYWDQSVILPDDLLVKTDRGSMFSSLEMRCPFLDKAVIALAQQLPASYKIKDGWGKWILRMLLSKYLPDTTAWAKKRGFSVPLVQWLQGPLKPYCERFYDREYLRQYEGLLSMSEIETALQQYEKTRSGLSAWKLWSLLMFFLWYDASHR